MWKTNLNILAAVCVLMMILAVPAGADTHYVSPGESIQSAIDAANDNDEIEVAPGTYNEAINFNGKAVRLYSSGGPDITTIDGSGNYHVVQCVNGEDANTILEGFTITGGNANGIDAANQGGGMYNRDSSSTVKNCIFGGNSAGYGGGMLNDSSSPTVTDCTFTDNTATDFGGGMENYNGGSPTVTNCLFSGNTAEDGGGMINNGCSPTVTNSIFTGNTSSAGGGMFNHSSSTAVTNCVFSGNSAGYGAGMWNYGSSPTLTNCTFSTNAGGSVGGMYNEAGSNPTVTNCILWGDTPNEIIDNASNTTVTYSDVQGGWGGTGNIDADPLFVNAAGSDLRLISSASPCVDTSTNTAPGLPATDLAGNPRVVDGDRDGTITVDMGAYELQRKQIRNITQNTWYETIQAAIDDANDGDQIEVGAGTYYEAINFNGKAVRLYSRGGPVVTTVDAIGLSSSVVRCISGEGLNTILEGFTITGGTGTLDEYMQLCGGGMRNENSSPTVTNCIFTSNSAEFGGGLFNYASSAMVSDCTFTNNTVSRWGAGLYNNNSSPTVTNCTFSSNEADQKGGGMYNGNSSNPTVSYCNFTDNSAMEGGGMSNNNSSPTVTNCIFTGNASGAGGGMFNGGGGPDVTNCIFSGNSAGYGAGMWNYGSSPTVTNCTFSTNAGSTGGGMYNEADSNTTVTNCILWGDTPNEIIDYASNTTVNYSDVQCGQAGLGNIDTDPCFANAALGDLRLLSDVSPCIDAGDSNALPADTADLDGDGNTVEPIPFDLDGNPRVVDGDRDGTATVDMGAYEFIEGLLAHWKLDERSGDIAWDSSGYAHHGTLYGDPNWQPSGGQIAGALEFDGDGDAVGIPKVADCKDFTYALWVNQNVIGSFLRALINHKAYIDGSIHFELIDGKPKVGIKGTTDPLGDLVALDYTLAAGDWNHVVLTKSTEYLRLYVDAELAAERELIESDPVILGDGYIGAFLHPQWGDRCFNGLIDDVRIYNYALTYDQILHILCTKPIKSDLDGNCKVDFRDFALFMSDWLTCNLPWQELCWDQ
jgi:hypothetical protein